MVDHLCGLGLTSRQTMISKIDIPVPTGLAFEQDAQTVNCLSCQEATREEKPVEKAHGIQPKDKQSVQK